MLYDQWLLTGSISNSSGAAANGSECHAESVELELCSGQDAVETRGLDDSWDHLRIVVRHLFELIVARVLGSVCVRYGTSRATSWILSSFLTN